MKKTSIIILLAFTIQSFAQELNKNLQSAFAKSYEYEYAYNYDDAIKSIQQFSNATSYEVNVRLGWLNYLKGEHTQSIAYYKKAITSNPSSIEARLGIANPLSYIGNWEEITNQYLAIVKLDSKNYTANYRLALIYYSSKKSAKAITYINSLSVLYPFDYEVNLLSAKINITLGSISNAKNALNKCLLYNPSSSEAIELSNKL